MSRPPLLTGRMMARIIANMIARNESGRYLKRVLEHTSKFADLIVFTDDCSEDDTPNIAEDMGAEVFQTDTPTFTRNEGLLRQQSWWNLEQFAQEGDWVLAVDADELFYPTDQLDDWLEQDRYHVLGVRFYHMWNETHYRDDKFWVPTMSSRLFRYFPGGTFPNRALACGSEPQYVAQLIRRGRYNPRTGFMMKHLGYARDEDKKSKYERYAKLDGGKYHAKTHIESIMDPNPELSSWSEVYIDNGVSR